MESTPSFAALGEALRSLEPISLRLGELTSKMPGSALADLMKSVSSPLPALFEATRGMDKLMKSVSPFGNLALDLKGRSDLLRTVAWPTAGMAEHFAGMKALADVGSVTRQLFESSRLTALADSRLWEFRTEAFRGFETLRITPIVADFTCVAGLYSSFLSRSAATDRPLPPRVATIPAREYFLSAEVCAETAEEEQNPDSPDEACAEAREEIRLHVYATVDEALSALDAELLKLWHGAVQATTSDNPDRIRHAITSLRELFTQVIHRLAPDNDIANWSSDPKHFDKNRPTRRARLAYILAGLNHDPFTDFLGADIDSLLKLIGAFQGGTHNQTTELSLPQMRIVFHRASSTLCSLIETRLAVN